MIIDHITIDHHDYRSYNNWSSRSYVPLFIDGEEAGSACKEDSKDPRKNIVDAKIVISRSHPRVPTTLRMFLTIPTSAISSSSSSSPSSFSSSSCSPSSLIFSFLPLSFCLSSANLSLLFFLEIWGFPGIFLTEKKIGLVHHRYWKLEMRAGEISSCDKSTQWGQSLVGIGSLPSKSSKSDKDKYETKNWDKDSDNFTGKEKWAFTGLILVVCKGKSSKSELKWSVTQQFFVLR